MTDISFDEVPSHWELTTLSQVASKITDGSHNPPPKQDSGLPMLSALNINDNRISFDSYRKITAADFDREDRRTQVSAGDVLLTIVGTIGRAAVVPSYAPPFTLQRSVAVIKPLEIDGRFLMYQLESPRTATYLEANAKGTAQQGIYLRTLSETPFLVPPLNEQRRIVDKIETLFARLDKGEEALRAVQALLARYRQSVLKAAVTGQLTADWRAENAHRLEPANQLLARILKTRRETWTGRGKYQEPAAPDTTDLPDLPEGWVWASVEQLAHVMGGLTKNSKRSALPLKKPMLRVANVYQSRLELDDVHMAGVTEGECERVLLEDLDLLVVEGNGSKDQIGRMAVWRNEIPDAVHQNHLIKVRMAEKGLVHFALWWFQSPSGRQTVADVASSTSGLYTLSISKIEALVVPMPSLLEVAEINALVDEYLTKIAQLEAWCQTELTRSAALRQSILKDAFAGRLVPQDPADEPAAALLTRIRATRTAAPAKRKTNA